MTEGAEPDMEYIQTSGVGKVMAQALGNMYRSRPKFPVDFLAKWLDNYCFQRDFERQLKSGEVCREELHKKFLEDLAERRRVEKEQEQKLAKEKQELQDLKDKIRDEVAHETLISEAIPNQIFNRVDLTGVYVGLYAPRRSRESEEADEGGEGEQEIPSYALQYIGGDAESMKLLKGKELPEGQGVTLQVFKEEGEQVDDPEANTASQSIKDANGCIYVPDVVMNPDMYFFKIPRLGAYYAVPMMVKSYLNDASLDDAIAKLKAYTESVTENTTLKQAKLDEINEKMDATGGPSDEEYQRLAEELEELEQNWENVPEPVFEADTRLYVLCCDTLGKDKEISEADRAFIYEFCTHFKNSWETKELDLIKAEAETLIRYEAEEQPEEKIILFEEALERDHKAHLSDIGEPDEGLGGLDVRYNEHEAKRTVLLEQLFSDPVKRVLFDLATFEHIKFSTIPQLAFVLAGYKKEDINLPDSDTLNWRKMRHEWTEGLLVKLSDFDYKGPKDRAVPPYATMTSLRRRLNKFEASVKSRAGDGDLNVVRQVSLFNYGLGRLYVLLDTLVNLREADILIRRANFKRARAERVDALERKRVRNNRMREEMADAEAEEGENFNQADWMIDFNNANPEVEILEEPKRDIDLDYDANEELTARDGDDDALGEDGQGLEEQGNEPERKDSVESGKEES